MKKFISFENKQLLPSLQKVLGVADSKSTIGILSNVYFEKLDNKLRLTATDTEIQISVDINEINLENNDIKEICVNAKKLANLLKSFNHTDNCELKTADDNEKLIFSCNRSRFSLQTNNCEDFPKLEFDNDDVCTFTMKAIDFKKLLKQTHFAVGIKDIRYYLNGVLLDVKPHKIISVATDGNRLAYSAITNENNLPETNAIIPRKTILELIKLVSDELMEINISISKSAVKFEFENIILITKVVDGTYPDYNRVIATDFNYGVKINRLELIKALQQCSLVFTGDNNNKFGGVLFELSAENLKLTTQNTQQEDSIVDIPIDYNGETVSIGLNINYVLEKLNSITDEFVIMRIIDGESTAMFSGYSYRQESDNENETDFKALPIESDGNDVDDNGNFIVKTYEKYVVMPMRI